MAKKATPSIFSTLQKTTENASAVNGELVRQLPVSALENNPLNRFSMAEDAEFLSTLHSVEKEGFLEDIVVTPAETPEHWRIISGHRRVAAAKKLGKATVPCKVRTYPDELAELLALMGPNIHRRALSPFDMARQLDTLRGVLRKSGALPETVREQAEKMAQETALSRATVERYLDLLNLDETLTAWAEQGKMTMTDAYELARRKNIPLYPLVEQYVDTHKPENGEEFSALVHRAILAAKEGTPAEPASDTPKKPAREGDALRKLDSFGRSVRRSAAALQDLDLTGAPDETARRKLDTCLNNLDALRRTVLALRETLEPPKQEP